MRQDRRGIRTQVAPGPIHEEGHVDPRCFERRPPTKSADILGALQRAWLRSPEYHPVAWVATYVGCHQSAWSRKSMTYREIYAQVDYLKRAGPGRCVWPYPVAPTAAADTAAQATSGCWMSECAPEKKDLVVAITEDASIELKVPTASP